MAWTRAEMLGMFWAWDVLVPMVLGDGGWVPVEGVLACEFEACCGGVETRGTPFSWTGGRDGCA